MAYAFIDKITTLNYPDGVYVDDSYIYVTEQINDRIRIYDKASPYGFVANVGSSGSGDGQLDGPYGIFVDANYIYVADKNNSRVQLFDKASPYAFVGKFGSVGTGDGQFTNIFDIFVDSSYIYTTEDSSSTSRVQIFNKTAPYAFVGKFGTYGTSDGQFWGARGIFVDSNYIYAGDDGNSRVQIFNKTSPYTFIGKFGSLGSGDGQFNSVQGVYVDGDYIFVSEDTNDRVQRFDKASPYGFVDKFGTGGAGDGQFDVARKLFVGDNIVYVADQNNHRLQLFGGPPSDPTGLTATCFTKEAPHLTGITVTIPSKELSGKLSLVNGSEIVNGVGTSFQTELQVGDHISINGKGYVVASISSDTKMTLTEVYGGATRTGVEFTKLSQRIKFTPGVGGFEPSAQYTGSLSVTNGVADVVGVGTHFLTELSVGGLITIDDVVYAIASITDDTHMALTVVYAGTTATDVDFNKAQVFTGTLAVTNGSFDVVGTGTKFLTDFKTGSRIIINNVAYTVARVIDDTNLELLESYAGGTDSGLAYYKASSYSGTISVTNGSANVVGTGTLFTLDYKVGNRISIKGVIYTIATITDDTHMTLTRNYAGTTDSGITVREAHQYTGLIALENGTNVVTGTGTSFTTEFDAGDTVTIMGRTYTIDSIASDTVMYLTEVWQGATASSVNMFNSVETAFFWEFGDGDTSTSFDPEHTYAEAGVYTARCTIVNQFGVSTYEWTVVIESMEEVILPPISDFNADTQYSTSPITVNFTDTSSGNPDAWEWYVDGVLQASTQDFNHLFSSDGAYLVELRVQKDGVWETSSSQTIVVASGVDTPPLVNGIVTTSQPVSGTGSLTTSFDATATTKKYSGTLNVTPDSTAVVGTGTAFTTELTEGQELVIGGVTYIVGTITDDTNLTLTAKYSESADASIDYFGQEGAVTYSWDFGDGFSSTSAAPTHTFTESGVYTVTLQTTNSLGTTTTTMQVIVAQITDVDAPFAGASIGGQKIGYYIVDSGEHRVLVYERDGTFIKSFGGLGIIDGKFNAPTRMTLIGGVNLIDRVER